MDGRALSIQAAAVVLSAGAFNLLRRGHNGSLVLSADRWTCIGMVGNALRFDAVNPREGAPPPLDVPLDARSHFRRSPGIYRNSRQPSRFNCQGTQGLGAGKVLIAAKRRLC